MKGLILALALAAGVATTTPASAQAPFNLVRSFNQQTASMPTFALFTPNADGDYTAIRSITAMGAGSALEVVLSWTDSQGSRSAVLFSPARPGGSLPIKFHALAGTPVSLATTYSPGPSTSYNIYLAISGQ